VVPRTFIGSVLLAWLATPVIWLGASCGFLATKFEIQILGGHPYLTLSSSLVLIWSHSSPGSGQFKRMDTVSYQKSNHETFWTRYWSIFLFSDVLSVPFSILDG